MALSEKKINAILTANQTAWLETLAALPADAGPEVFAQARETFALKYASEGSGKAPGKREARSATAVCFARVNGVETYVGKATCPAANAADSRGVTESMLLAAAMRAGAEHGTVRIAYLTTHDGDFVTI